MRLCVKQGLVVGWVMMVFGGSWAGEEHGRMNLVMTNGVPRVGLTAPSNMVTVLESSADLAGWREWLRGHGPIEGVPDLRLNRPDASFYRGLIRPLGPNDDAKNLMTHPGDGFQSPEREPWRRESRWVKFAILLSEPYRVWFQDSARYPFHYEFARARLPGFEGLTRAAFDAATLRTNGQRAVLGAVLIPPAGVTGEIGVQFVGLDPYPREQVAEWFETVREMIRRPAGVEVLYLPTFEQAEVARQNEVWFAGRGIPLSGAGRWVVGNECYAPGWALGLLKFVPAAQIAEAYRIGILTPDDILLTDAVPAEVPPLAGLVTLSPATPNSHVALLARSFGIPFVHLSDPERQDSARHWTNREVILRAVQNFDGCDLDFSAVEGEIEEGQREAIRALKEPPQLNLPGIRPSASFTMPTEGLRPSDIDRVGGKAANFGVLRRAIPAQSPSPSLAITFDLWEAYLDQDLGGAGGTLRSSIAGRLAGFAWPPDMAALQTALAEIREWITDEADFDGDQREAILGALQAAGFDPLHNIRFRSSTNVEDSQQFSGAGLYDSYSGCLADELDGDEAGPSACDPEESKELGVFRALRKVYASFYNDNAFLERLRHRVDETRVGMAVLVHPSTPDPFELANGVAALRLNPGSPRLLTGDLVTQWGAVSVANPDSTAVPETVAVFQSGGSASLSVEQRSSLVPLGDTVMAWDADYRSLVKALDAASVGFAGEFPGRESFHLDFEYKKEAPSGRVFVKQVREIPEPTERTFTPWLIPTGGRYSILQGEHGDIMANHRLKSAWRFEVRTVEMTDANLGMSVFKELGAEWIVDGVSQEFGGVPATLPDYVFRKDAESLRESWSQGGGAGRRVLELRVPRIRETDHRRGPLVTLGDHRLELTVAYATPQPTLGFDPVGGGIIRTTTSRETAWLAPVVPVSAESLRQERVLQRGGAEVRTTFWWPPPPTGPTAGYTAPVQEWVETTITGLTSRPIVLRSEWAQTYRPGHHNFFEDFAFEPGLDAEVPPDLLAELHAANIRALILSGAPGGPVDLAYLWGVDGVLRRW